MTDTVDVVVAIGRNVNGEPMSYDDWGSFRSSVSAAFTMIPEASINARVDGVSSDHEWGTEEAYWVAASVPRHSLPALKKLLREDAKTYYQDAIALTVGKTEMITREER